MAKQIVVCMDGTWNDPTEQTNVYKLFHLLAGQEQGLAEAGAMCQHLRKENPGLLAFYLEGVGAQGRSQGPLGGGLGIGLHDRVIDAFVLISQAWQPGDKLWIFGFSRGAWSARSLAGFVAGAGLLGEAGRADAATRAEALWLEYKHGKLGNRGEAFWRERAGEGDPQPIRLVGVWDTVGALGIPLFNGLRVVDGIEARLFEFADRDLSPRVQFGRHGLAIDETRFDFTPAPWNPRPGIRQVWFPGVHGDVGGGYSHCGLSDGALAWMIDEVNGLQAGLRITAAGLAPDPLEDRHDEARKRVWQMRPRQPRQIAPNAPLAPAVIARLAGRADYRPAALRPVPACAEYFAPGNPAPEESLQAVRETLPTRRLDPGETDACVVFAQKWWNAAGIQVKTGERYRVAASGTWSDRDHGADASGYASDSVLLRLAEGTRRMEKGLWFALVAAIHPEVTLELKNPTSGNFATDSAESFVRGVGKVDGASQLLAPGPLGEITADRDGFLYFFANDSAFAYSNNRGYLDVTVTRVT